MSGIQIELSGITEEEMDELAKDLPPGFSAQKLAITPLSFDAVTAFYSGVIDIAKTAANAAVGILAQRLMMLRAKRQEKRAVNYSHTICIDHEEVELTAGEVTRVITDRIRIKTNGDKAQ